MYTEISETELYARLHFYENHTQYLNSELEKSNRKSAEQAEEIKELKNELNRITDFLRLAGKKIYGSSTEKICEAYGQLSFFDDAEENESEAVPVAPKKVKSYTRKEKRSYDEMLRDMPRKIVVHSLSEEEKICSVCGSEMSVIGYDSFLQVEYHRATIEVVEHRKEKAVCKSCDRNNEKSTFKTAASPTPLIERSYVSPSLLAHIICEKYVKAVPLYRLEQELNSYGWRISRQTMDNWILGAADILLPSNHTPFPPRPPHDIIKEKQTKGGTHERIGEVGGQNSGIQSKREKSACVVRRKRREARHTSILAGTA